ncbi:MAG: FtsX-like permease family protein [Chloroflexota bacterium]
MLAASLLLVCATTLLAAGALYGDVVALGGLRRAVLDASAAQRTVLVRSSMPVGQLTAVDQSVRSAITEALGSGTGEIGLVAQTGSYTPSAATGSGGGSGDAADLTRLGAYPAIADHATLAGGRWPTPGHDPLEAALSEAAATALGLHVGDAVTLTSRVNASQVLHATIVGTWRPTPGDVYWIDDPLELLGVDTRGSFTTRGPFVVPLEDLTSGKVETNVDVQWRAPLGGPGLRVDAVDATRTNIEKLQDRLKTTPGVPRSTTVTSGLPTILGDVGRSILVSRSGILVLTVEFGVLAGYAIVLVAGTLVERRRTEVALFRTRGASSGHLAAMAIGEAILLAVPAAIIAPFLATVVVRLLGASGPIAGSGIVDDVGLSTAAIVVAVIAAVACVIALTLPPVVSNANPAGVRASMGRQGGRTLAQRIGIDLVLVVIAAIALWQLRLYGSPLTRNARGLLGVDPLLVAAPALGLLAGGILATRVIPRIAEGLQHLLERRRGLVGPLGGRQLARRPLRYTRSALLLMLAAALGTFASAHAATWTRSQADQATYRAASDVRVIASDYPQLPAWAAAPAYRAIPGVRSVMEVGVEPADVGRAVRGGKLLEVDAANAAGIVNLPPDGTTSTVPPLLAKLAAARPAATGVDITGARRMSVVLDADIKQADAGEGALPLPPDSRGIDVSVVVEDRAGRLHEIDGGNALLSGKGQRIEVSFTSDIGGTTAAFEPDRLHAVELQITAPADVFAVAGSVDARSVETSASATGSDWTPVDVSGISPGWDWSVQSQDSLRPYPTSPADPSRLSFGLSPATEPLFPGAQLTYRLWANPGDDKPIPGIAGRTFLDQSGGSVGDEVAVSVAGRSVSVEIVGVTDDFPPLDPASPFIVVDAPTLALRGFDEEAHVSAASEYWLSVDPDRAAPIAATLRDTKYSAASVLSRAELSRTLSTDPVPLGVIGVLGLGSIAAMAFAAIGFVVSATVSLTERVGEFALLRALGLSVRQLSIWLTMENVFLLVVGLVAGTALGVLLSVLVLPYVTLTETGAAAVPTPSVVLPWDAIAPIYVLAVVLLVVTVLIVRRQLPAIRIGSVLRAGES